jgi:hypothetical protein
MFAKLPLTIFSLLFKPLISSLTRLFCFSSMQTGFVASHFIKKPQRNRHIYIIQIEVKQVVNISRI